MQVGTLPLKFGSLHDNWDILLKYLFDIFGIQLYRHVA